MHCERRESRRRKPPHPQELRPLGRPADARAGQPDVEAGLKRINGLLRSYEQGEAAMPARDRRQPIDCRFLCDSPGLQRA
jgi:hypothetical protein